MKVLSLILAGGKGTRLWPLSRENKPKQFIKLASQQTLLENTFNRIQETIDAEQWLITTDEMVDYFKLYVDAYDDWKGSENVKFLVEPQSKNTVASILWGSSLAKRTYDEDTIMIISPSDHVIEDSNAYLSDVQKGISLAQNDKFVVFGVPPTSPENAYGYIGIDKEDNSVTEYIEKPDVFVASELIEQGNYYWNTGIYIFKISTFLNQVNHIIPHICKMFDTDKILDSDYVKQLYKEVPSLSINSTIIENLSNLTMVPFNSCWNALNSWKSYHSISEKDDDGNVLGDKAISLDTKNSLVYSDDKFVSLVGLQNVGVVSVDDSIIVCNLDESEKVKQLYHKLITTERKEINYNNIGVRPWGSYFVLEGGLNYKIKRIQVDPKQMLSLQMHFHRSEHWIVVKGVAKVTNGDNEFYVHENESTYIPATTKHRLENPGVLPLELIEVQCGTYLEEDDIVRYDDIYDRK